MVGRRLDSSQRFDWTLQNVRWIAQGGVFLCDFLLCLFFGGERGSRFLPGFPKKKLHCLYIFLGSYYFS